MVCVCCYMILMLYEVNRLCMCNWNSFFFISIVEIWISYVMVLIWRCYLKTLFQNSAASTPVRCPADAGGKLSFPVSFFFLLLPSSSTSLQNRYIFCSEPIGFFTGDPLAVKGNVAIDGLGGAMRIWSGSREGGRLLGLNEPPDLVLPFKIYGGSLHGGARDSVGSSSTFGSTYLCAGETIGGVLWWAVKNGSEIRFSVKDALQGPTPSEWSTGGVFFAGGTRWCSTSQRRRRGLCLAGGTSPHYWKLCVLNQSRCCRRSPSFSVRNMFPSFWVRSRTQSSNAMVYAGYAPFWCCSVGPSFHSNHLATNAMVSWSHLM